MGWLKLDKLEARVAHRAHVEPFPTSLADEVKFTPTIEHVEIKLEPETHLPRPRFNASTPNAELPFISKEELAKVKTEGRAIWIVIDQIVYDCTDFVAGHPGGRNVIENFSGEDCSWQFWRIHSRQHLTEDGGALRVGRTEGVTNRFKEVPKYIGLMKLWNHDHW